MRIVRLEQNSEAWLLHRMGKATGSKAKSLKPLVRGEDKTPQGFWKLVAEKMSIPPDGERPMDRGHRLEDEALTRLATDYNLDIDLEPGMWESDIDDDIAISPDGAEKGETLETIPTWAAEVKCLSSDNHIKYIVKDIDAKKRPGYNGYYSIPDEYSCAYREQVLQYFVVNESLQTLYFVLYDDRVQLDQYVFYVIAVQRDDVEELCQGQKYQQIDMLVKVNKLVTRLAGEE